MFVSCSHGYARQTTTVPAAPTHFVVITEVTHVAGYSREGTTFRRQKMLIAPVGFIVKRMVNQLNINTFDEQQIIYVVFLLQISVGSIYTAREKGHSFAVVFCMSRYAAFY